MSACAAVAPAPAVPTAAPPVLPSIFQPALGRTLAYLVRQVDDTGLLRAAPDSAPARHWLLVDNELALWALEEANADEVATPLRAALAAYAPPTHGLLEALRHEVVAWPPRSATEVELQPGIWLETRTGEEVVEDWAQQSDLAFYAALNAWNGGDQAEARRLYTQALSAFDGTGFVDGDFDGRYSTTKLALATFTGARLGLPVEKALVDALLHQQAENGGFAAYYTAEGGAGDTDSATSAYAALALMALRQE
jgi:hypothetical protein